MSTFFIMKCVKSKKRLLIRQKCEKRSKVLSFKKEGNEIEAYHVQKKFKEGIKHNIAIEVKIQGGDQKTLKHTMCKKFKDTALSKEMYHITCPYTTRFGTGQCCRREIL